MVETQASPRPQKRAVSRQRLHGNLAHALAVEIISGRLKPGEILPNEANPLADLAVSRTVYREAVKILGAKGLIETRPKTGTRVLPRNRWNLLDPDILAWHLEVEASPNFIRALFELRAIVEPAAAGLAALRHSPTDAKAMWRALERMGTADPALDEGLEADLELHHAILQAAGNEPLLSLWSLVESSLRWTVKLKRVSHPQSIRAALPEHERVVALICKGDAAAAERHMRKLIEDALEDTLRSLNLRQSA
jgi:DNA-binding FadR family transcriptional regulator